jgi:hypothetical protein
MRQDSRTNEGVHSEFGILLSRPAYCYVFGASQAFTKFVCICEVKLLCAGAVNDEGRVALA